MPYKDIEKERIYRRLYYKKYYSKNKDKINKLKRANHIKRKVKIREYNKNYREIRSFIWTLAKSLDENNFKFENEEKCPICGEKKYYKAKKCKNCFAVWNKGLTKETSEIIRKATEKMKKNHVSWIRDGHLTNKHKQKISQSHIGLRHSEETKRKISKLQKGRKLTEEWKKKIGESGKGRIVSEETRKKIGDAQRGEKHHFFGRHLTEEHKKKISIGNRGKIISLEQRKAISKKIKEKYKNDFEFLMKKYTGLNQKPNNKEKIIFDLIKMYNLHYEYVGNGKFWIDGKNPDFVNVNGQKKIIELFGDYWHTKMAKETPEERINHFKKYGFDCLIIWEKELKNINDVTKRIMEFDKNGG